MKTMQGWSLQRKIQVTQLRIMEWYEHYGGKVYVSFSGGKDSTVLLDLARRAYPEIEAVFVDTGLEYPEIRQFVKQHDNVTILRPKMRFGEVIKKYGYPVISKEVSRRVYDVKKNGVGSYAYKMFEGKYLNKIGEKSEAYNIERWKFLIDSPFKISHNCCNVMKKSPAHAYGRKSGKYPITGQMAYESAQRRTQWELNGCNGFSMKSPISNPMSFWTEQDVLSYIHIMQEKWDSNIRIANMVVRSRTDRKERKQARKFITKEKRRFEICSVYGDIVADNEGQTELFETTKHYHCTGCQRTGCMFCMFGVHLEKEPNRFQRMKITHPKQYDYCINQLGLGKVLDYIGVKYK